MDPDHHLPAEVTAAILAVRAASEMCADVQGRLQAGGTITKGDDSPVTVADFAAQAIVCAALTEALGDIVLVGEEDHTDLRAVDRAALLDGVVEIVSTQLGASVSSTTVLDWISMGSADGQSERYWTLDPIDGTKGFLRGDQYAIALALIDRGEVVLGVLGCPNLPNPDGTSGALFVAGDLAGASTDPADSDALDGAGSSRTACVAYYGSSTTLIPVRVAEQPTMSSARFCESVESGHSDQGQSAEIAALLGITGAPYRIDSQCKYAAVARGDASIYLRLPTQANYREKIWDHAAGKFVVECAGGHVTDVTGAPLEFRHGRRLERNRGVVATGGVDHAEVVAAVGRVLDR
jgi:3'(2'), 5'-bisphosphate nucleotidase